MPGSATALGRASTRSNALARIAFRQRNSVGAQDDVDFAAQWLAYAIPHRRFADVLADHCARLGADVVCYAFIVADLHHLLLAGLPAHSLHGLLRWFWKCAVRVKQSTYFTSPAEGPGCVKTWQVGFDPFAYGRSLGVLGFWTITAVTGR